MKTVRIFLTAAFLMILFTMEAGAMEREVLDFNTGWLYSPVEYINGQEKSLDDSGFEKVCVPHANKVIETHKGDDFQKQIDSYRFVSWYRRHFTLGEEYAEKRVIVQFEAVATVADVYVNGKYVGGHKGAYTGFEFDITDYLELGEDNVLAVRVDSTKRSDIPPEGGSVDYCLFGGIVRDVNMLIVNDTYIDDVFYTTPELKDGKAFVMAEVSVMGGKNAEAVTVIYDADGNEKSSARADVDENGKVTLKTNEIENCRLWSTDAPYLYNAVTTIYIDGKEADSVSTKIGMRYFEFRSGDTDASFYLNGEKMVLRGVNRHEQWPWQGRAIPDKLQRDDARLLKETGFNAVRCSHYPQDTSFLSECDALGLIVFEEAPGWQHVGNEAWKEVYRQNVREMIERDRNHPSIVTWGIRVNESFDDPDFVKSAASITRELDPTRPNHGVRRNESYNDSEMIEDIFGCNYQYPEKPRYTPFVSTEHSWECWTNGCGCPWATDGDAMKFTKSFADVVDYYYRNDLCAGGFAWSMFDYNNEVNYTRTGHVFYSGLYDIFRQPKPVAYFYKSQHRGEPMAYIANYWTESSPSAVEVYSNCEEAELFVNGVSKGRIKPNLYMNVPHPAFRFENIEFEAGELRVVGYIGGEKAAEAVRLTPKEGKRIKLTPNYSVLTADGTDMTEVIIELVDENGTRLPYADDVVTISVTGAGEFIGERSIALEGGRAGFIVKTRYMEEGKVLCSAEADGLESGKCEIEVEKFNETNFVPFSEGEQIVKPLGAEDVNDTDERFEYSENWLYCAENGCYRTDNHYASEAGDIVNFRFVGECAEWYGTTAPNHGIMTVSIDGGKETFIDCYSETRHDNVLLYTTGPLAKGEHVLTVRVTGQKNEKSQGTYVNADRVKVYESAYSLNGIKRKISFDGLSGEWEKDGGVLRQTKGGFGDQMAVFDESEGTFIQSFVSVPTENDTGSGVLACIGDDTHYYQLELKYENGLSWNIWKNDGNIWTLLRSGPFEGGADKVCLRLTAAGGKVSAFASADGRKWTPLGCAFDSTYASGASGVRTHNMSGEFSEVVLGDVNLVSGGEYALKDISRDGDVLKLRISVEDEKAKLILALYDNKGTLLKTKTMKPEGEEAEISGIDMKNRNKVFIWSGDDMEPLGEEIEY